MSSSLGESDEPERAGPAERGKRSAAGWLRLRSPEKTILARLSAISGLVSAVATYVQLGHSAIVVLSWAIGISIVVPVATIAIYRSVIHRLEMPVVLMLASGIVAALLGIGGGVIIRSVTAGSGSTQDRPVAASAPTTTVTGGSASRTSGATSATGTIVVPRDGATITGGAQLSASGTVRHLPSAYRLDLFLKIPSVARYYVAGDPRTALTIAGGNWSGAIYIGTQGPCTIYLVTLSPASVTLMNSEPDYQSGGFPSITALGTILASVSLTAN